MRPKGFVLLGDKWPACIEIDSIKSITEHNIMISTPKGDHWLTVDEGAASAGDLIAAAQMEDAKADADARLNILTMWDKPLSEKKPLKAGRPAMKGKCGYIGYCKHPWGSGVCTDCEDWEPSQPS